eukprot:TRINITY_DN4100_c0_g1_i4.p4 TRINITY_DN4100_c0_g1~~TRINITY_DN4100_c0_g1_i4.p4  ORF type:complete len:160 (+),score=5.78 TRINITY_DN4100_c0_g1_i4:672-1151(+)
MPPPKASAKQGFRAKIWNQITAGLAILNIILVQQKLREPTNLFHKRGTPINLKNEKKSKKLQKKLIYVNYLQELSVPAKKQKPKILSSKTFKRSIHKKWIIPLKYAQFQHNGSELSIHNTMQYLLWKICNLLFQFNTLVLVPNEPVSTKLITNKFYLQI